MPFTIGHFESLRQRFPTWEEFRAYIQTDEGGKLRVVEDSSNFAVLRYSKGTSNLQNAELGTGLFRSVVWDKSLNIPVCVAPAKALSNSPPVNMTLASVEDFVDGFMVNAYVVGGDPTLHIATRTMLGGSNSFYSQKTFGQMFEECVAATPYRTVASLTDALVKANTGASLFVSFVLQHPEHRIVSKIVSPAVHVAHMGTVSATGQVSIYETPDASLWPSGLQRLQVTSYPTRTFHTQKEIDDLLRKISVTRGWRWQGLVFKDGRGARWRLRTPTYTMLRELRGAESKSLDRFLRLRVQKKMGEYLKHYAEDRDEFWQFEQTLRARTSDVLTAYNDVHKLHAIKFAELPLEYKPAVFRLHVKYLEELRPKNFTIRIQNVIDIVNTLKDFEQKRLMDGKPYVAVVRDLSGNRDLSGALPPSSTTNA
jgi:hypothetical protein